MAVTVAAVKALPVGTAIDGFGASGAGYAAAHGMSVGAIVMKAIASKLAISSGFAPTIKSSNKGSLECLRGIPSSFNSALVADVV